MLEWTLELLVSCYQRLFDIIGVLWAELGLVQIWDGFRETLGHRQLELEQNPQLLESEATQLWALVVVVRDQLDVEFYDHFEKLKCNENLFVLRAWLQEWERVLIRGLQALAVRDAVVSLSTDLFEDTYFRV